MITNDEYEKRKEALEGASMVTIWENIHPASLSGKITLSFDEEKELFFWFIERLMYEGKVKFGNGGVFWTGTIKEQISKFRESIGFYLMLVLRGLSGFTKTVTRIGLRRDRLANGIYLY